MPSTSYVTAGKPKTGGAVYVAPVGTDLPTSAAEELGGLWLDVGYISEDGVTNSNSIESSDIKEWGGNTVLTLQTGKSDQFKMKFLEAMNSNVLTVIYGEDNVSGSLEEGLTVKANADEAAQWSWVIDMILRGNIAKRIVIPAASISELGDIVYNSSDAVAFDATLSAVPDDEGNTHYDYMISAGSAATYSVSVTEPENGTAFASVSAAAEGDTVTVAASPAEGYAFSGWTSSTVTFDDATAAVTTFTMPASAVTVAAAFEEEE